MARHQISQLDLQLLGGRGFPQRLAGLERGVRSIQAGSTEDDIFAPTSQARTNLALNSSFESYNRTETKPEGWYISGLAHLIPEDTDALDGTATMRLLPGAAVSQTLLGASPLPQCSLVVSWGARAEGYVQKTDCQLLHSAGYQDGGIVRLDPDGDVAATDVVPNDGRWYRFFRAYILKGSSLATVAIKNTNTSSGSLAVDAVKVEREDNISEFLQPSVYVSGDYGTAHTIRNLRADNIVAGTLTVGGSDSDDPHISVRDDQNLEIVTIGDPKAGYYGVHVTGKAGVRVDGTGSVEVAGGGNVEVRNGGKVIAGEEGANRTEMAADGISGFNPSGERTVHLSSSNGILYVEKAEAFKIVGTGSVVAGDEDGRRTEIGAGSIIAYDENGEEITAISSVDKQLRVRADAFVVTGQVRFDSLQVEGAVDIVNGGDLRVGSNVLVVNNAGRRVGINKVADPQFDLDVAGSFRAGGYIVGRHAIQLDDAELIAHFDTAKEGTTGDLRGHKGQVPGLGGTPQFVPGKFNTALYVPNGSAVHYYGLISPTQASGTVMCWAKTSDPAGHIMWSQGWGRVTLDKRDDASGKLGVRWNGVRYETDHIVDADWHHYAVTWEPAVGTTLVSVYVDGELVWYEFLAALSNTETFFSVGAWGDYQYSWGGPVDDLVILKRTLPREEIRAVVESDAPVFAETSSWGFRSASSLAWADEQGLWAIDASGKAAFGVSGVNGKSWGQVAMNAGDVLIGNNLSYLFFDADANGGTVYFRGDGSGLTSINGGNITTGTVTANALSGNAIDGKVITGAVVQTAATGRRVYIDVNGLRLQDSNGINQVYGATDNSGALYAGNGAVRLDINGITLFPGSAGGDPKRYRLSWSENNNIVASVYGSGTATSGGAYLVADPTSQDYPFDDGFYVAVNRYTATTGAIGFHTNGIARMRIPHSGAIEINDSATVSGYVSASGGFNAPNGVFSRSTYEGTLHYRIRSASEGGWAWRFTDGGGVAEYFRVDYPTGDTTTPGKVVATGGFFPRLGTITTPSGAGAEFFYASYGQGGETYIQSYDRSASQHRPLAFVGSSYQFHNSGNVQIGVTTPAAPIASDRVRIVGADNSASNYALVVKNAGLANLMWLRNDGVAYSSYTPWNGSDKRLKEDIEDIDANDDRADRIQAKRYRRKKLDGSEEPSDRYEYGVVAQDLQTVAPDLVMEVEDGTLAVNYLGLHTLQIARLTKKLERALAKITVLERLLDRKA